MKIIKLIIVIILLCLPARAQYEPGSYGYAQPSVKQYIVDGDSHAWRQGCDREGKPGSVYGKTGIIEGFACDIASAYRLIGNYGTGGHTCQDVWNGRAETLKSPAKDIILSCGHNDTLKGVPNATTFYYIRYLTKWHKQLGRRVIWMTPPLATSWGGYGLNTMNARSKIVGQYIRNAGADCVIDAESIIRITKHLTDGIHVNKAGGAALAPYAKGCL